MKRQFKTDDNGERRVLSASDGWHMYHLECRPNDVVTLEKWASTRQSCCHKCHGPLFKNPVEVQP